MKKPHRLNLIYTPEVYYEQNYGARFIPLWAYTLAAYAPKDWEVSIFDCTILDRSQIPEASVFAFSGINQDFPSIMATYRYLKRKYPDAKFALGGPVTWSYEMDGRISELESFDHLFVLDGEETFPEFLNKVARDKQGEIDKVIRASRFPVAQARELRFDLLRLTAPKYYGGVIEVSRGCPFLCEFCDIRVLPNNNESHNKDVALIVKELDEYYKLGIRQIQLACDNFIGDLAWARECVQAILDWVQKSEARVALYTWITVNISRIPDLMIKMRKAGFTSLFIGVESFNANSILETAKVQNQNDKNQLIEALRTIQSYGFIVLPGLIFGFDSDPPMVFGDTIHGVLESGLIGGDPTFLLALPGTPLYARMKRTNRLIAFDPTNDTVPLYKRTGFENRNQYQISVAQGFLSQRFYEVYSELHPC